MKLFLSKDIRPSCILYGIKQENTKINTDVPFNVNQYHSVEFVVECIILIGIKPFLLPGVGIDVNKLCSVVSTIIEKENRKRLDQEENLSCPEVKCYVIYVSCNLFNYISILEFMFQKYERLCFSTDLLLIFFYDLNLRPVVLLRIGLLMAALLQLSHAPLTKPSIEGQSMNLNNQEFCMTKEEYERLQNRQKKFHTKFISLLNNCQRDTCFRELMVIFGVQNAPRWLRKETQNYLIKMLMEPNGVSSLIATIYNDDLDWGKDWKKLDTLFRLIAVTHGKNVDEYYKAICPQVS